MCMFKVSETQSTGSCFFFFFLNFEYSHLNFKTKMFCNWHSSISDVFEAAINVVKLCFFSSCVCNHLLSGALCN